MPDMKTRKLTSLLFQASRALSNASQLIHSHQFGSDLGTCSVRNPFQLGTLDFASFSTKSTTTMNVAVVHKAGGPEVFQIEKRVVPKAVSKSAIFET